MSRFFPVSQPSIGEREIALVTDAVRSGWVSSIGEYIERFERMFAEFCGTEYAVAASNGTTALHLALACLGIKSGDEVIIPDLTFIATANAVAYTGATVVPVDIDGRSLCLDPDAFEKAITSRTRAVIPVHLYGHPARMEKIAAIANTHGIAVVEDAAEAHGAKIGERKVGSLGDCGIFSFYGNKVITSGEGGMLTTNDREIFQKARYLRDHAMSAERRYWHTEVGFNYRMTNLQAALGVAQMERIEQFIEKRGQLMEWYRRGLGGISKLRLNYDEPGVKSVYWMVCVEIEGIEETKRAEIMARLKTEGVDTRPYFYPVSDMPMYSRAHTPVAHAVSVRGLNLPSYTDLSETDVGQICNSMKSVLAGLGALP